MPYCIKSYKSYAGCICKNFKRNCSGFSKYEKIQKYKYKKYENYCCDIKFKVTSRNGAVAITPPLSKSSSLKNQTLYDMSFAVQGPKLWNKVPQSIKVAETFDTFKRSLTDFLALIPDTPPVAGYSCRWSNSLIDYSPSRWSDI